MTELKATPGPWTVKVDPYGPEFDPPSEPYCTVTAGNGGYMGEGGFEISGIMPESDAHLIASSPRLYAALETIKRLIVKQYEFDKSKEDGSAYREGAADTSCELLNDAVPIIDAALSQARGERHE